MVRLVGLELTVVRLVVVRAYFWGLELIVVRVVGLELTVVRLVGVIAYSGKACGGVRAYSTW